MPSKIILKKSSVASKVPVAGDLDFGELAINYTDGKLYYKKADGTSIDSFITSTGSITGNAATATILQTARTINGVSFNGSANITVADSTKQPLDADLTAIAALTGTSGLLRKTAADTWSLDTNSYVTSSGVTSVSGTAPIISSGGTAPAISISAATTSAAGSMSAADKTKLDGIASGATANTGTVTSVSGAGGYGGLTLSGTVTTSGNLTLGGTPTGTWPISVSGSSASTVSPVFTGDSAVKDNITTRTESGFYESSTGTLAEGWPTNGNNWHHLIACTHSNDANYYSLQLSSTFFDQQLYFRATNGVGTTAWSTLLHSGNYNTYAPTLTGTGASGTWGINITGNAATATTLQTARTINGVSFDGSANITIPETDTLATVTGRGATTATALALTNTTASTAHTNGALTVSGGVGIAGRTSVNDIVNRITSAGNSAWLQQDGTGRTHWYWNTYGGATPVYTVAGEDASSITLHVNNGAGAGGSFFHRSANGVGKAAGEAITWTTTIYSDLNSFTWKGHTVLRSDNYNSYSPTLTGIGASGTWGISITGNAATITNQANSATIPGSVGITPSNIVVRDGSGFIYANYINFNQSETENPVISSFFTSNGDGWARKSSLAHVKNSIRGIADGTWGISITGNAATVTNGVYLTTAQTLTNKTVTGLRETKIAIPASNIDLNSGNFFTRTISGATTLTVSNAAASGSASSFILELTNAGSAAITWFSGVKWTGGTAPVLTASGVDILGFYTHDGGTTWRGLLLSKDSK